MALNELDYEQNIFIESFLKYIQFWLIHWLILTVLQPILCYFMSRG